MSLEAFEAAPRARIRGGDRISQVPGEPLLTCRALRPRRALRSPARPIRAVEERPVLPSDPRRSSAPGLVAFEAPSHGPFARCLRFVARVAPGASTQDSLPARWLSFGRTGLPPAGLLPRLSGCHRPPSCRARLVL